MADLLPTETFLNLIWGQADANEDARIALWELATKRSRYYPGVANVLDWMRGKTDAELANIYVAAGVAPKGLIGSQRAVAASVLGIGGVWVDLDVKGPGHKKENLPATIEEASKLVDELPIAPTFRIHSGGGLQCWWAFSDLWWFTDEAQRALAKRVVQGWQAFIRERCKAHGWDLDATHDLARVMRLPGTFNTKHGEPVPVRVMVADLRQRYTPQNFIDLLHLDGSFDPPPRPPKPPKDEPPANDAPPARDEPPKTRERWQQGRLKLDPAAKVDADLLEALFDVYPEARLTWQRKREDFTDRSASAYDSSLAVFACKAGWDDQQIADLLIHSRRKHGDDLKLDRGDDYYVRTIEWARRKTREDEQKRRAQETFDDLGRDAEPSKSRLLEAISAKLGVSIEKIVRFRTDPALYRITIAGETIDLGGSGALLDQQGFRKKVYDLTSIAIPHSKRWDDMANALGKACEDIYPGDEGSIVSQMIDWMRSYLDTKDPVDDPDVDWRERAASNHPFLKDDQVYISTGGRSGFLAHLRDFCGQTIPSQKVAIYLRAAGWEYRKVSYRFDGSVRNGGFWRIDKDRLDPKFDADEVHDEEVDEPADYEMGA